MVGQEPVLFCGTIRENITFGMDDVTEEQMIEAAKTAHAHQFITKLANVSTNVLISSKSPRYNMIASNSVSCKLI